MTSRAGRPTVDPPLKPTQCRVFKMPLQARTGGPRKQQVANSDGLNRCPHAQKKLNAHCTQSNTLLTAQQIANYPFYLICSATLLCMEYQRNIKIKTFF
jgi:hypothetical protein